MPNKVLAGISIEVDDEGYMTQPEKWSRPLAIELAKEEGIEISDAHWKVIEFIRKDAEENGSAPNVRRMTKVGGIGTKDLYELFPGGPAKKAAKISGYPKPHGCI